MGQGKSAHGDHHDRSSRHSSVSKVEKKKINLENAITPNGFLPPELVFSLMNQVDLDTYRALASTCKLWYETGQTTIYGSNLQLVGANMMKGLWWTEVLTNKFSPKFNFSYIASFQGNKVIVNNHHINPTSYGNYKFYKGGFMMDLTTMTKTTVPYGCIFANDYIVRCVKEINDPYFDWDSLEVLDKKLNVLHTIERKLKATPPPDNGGWGFLSPIETIHLFVNQKTDENSILLVNIPCDQSDDKPKKLTLEVWDLKTANMTMERKIEANRVHGFYGNHVIVGYSDKLTAYDLTSKHESTLTSDCKGPAFFIHEKEIAVRDKNKIKFLSLSTLKETKQIDMTPHMKPLPGKGQIYSIAFDNAKIVVGVDIDGTIVHFVLSLASNTMLTFMHSPYDRVYAGQMANVHLAPNGKIITDVSNLNVYDFAHPNANPELKVPVIYIKDTKAQVASVKFSELAQFAAQKLNVPWSKLKMRTMNHGTGSERVTMIYGRTGDYYNYGEYNYTFQAMFSDFEADQAKRSAWQLTTNDLTQFTTADHPDRYYYDDDDSAMLNTKEAVLVFEKLNSKNNRWEVSMPSNLSNNIELVKE